MSAPADVSSRVGPPATARRTFVSGVRAAVFAAADDALEAFFAVGAGAPRAGFAGAGAGFTGALIGAGAGNAGGDAEPGGAA